jgi:hypothetical protein
MIEDRLAATLDRVAADGPNEAGAFDRFVRHRARRSRRIAAATALGLSLVLALAVVLLDPPWDGDAVTTPALGPAETAHWRPGPLVAAAPLQGFEIDVPAGWEANRTRQGFELRPTSKDLRRQLPTPVQVDTFALDPRDHPQGAELFQDNNSFAGEISGTIGEYKTRTTGSFPDGRWWLRTDGGAPGRRTTFWYTPWPYWCQGGEPCPDVLALRTLRVVLLDAGDRVRAQAMELVPTLLRSARPITKAVAGRAYAPRPDCIDAVTARPSVTISKHGGSPSPHGGSPRTVQIVWRFSTSPYLIPCHFQRVLKLSFLDDGQPANLQGDDEQVLKGNLPEGSPLAPGVLGMEWRWTNWCGGNVQICWRGGLVSDAVPPSGDLLTPSTRPACVDPSKPSRLKIVEWGE